MAITRPLRLAQLPTVAEYQQQEQQEVLLLPKYRLSPGRCKLLELQRVEPMPGLAQLAQLARREGQTQASGQASGLLAEPKAEPTPEASKNLLQGPRVEQKLARLVEQTQGVAQTMQEGQTLQEQHRMHW